MIQFVGPWLKKAGFLVFSVCESATAERFVFSLFFFSPVAWHHISSQTFNPPRKRIASQAGLGHGAGEAGRAAGARIERFEPSSLRELPDFRREGLRVPQEGAILN